MNRYFRCLLFALATGLAAPGALATTATVDYSDLWWNPNESGWGMNVAQQATTLFLTFYIYGQDSKPTWVTGQLTQTGQGANGQPVFTGEIYATTGPWFGAGTFNPALVTLRKAGTVSFSPASATTATLVYSVDGVSVTKSVRRQTLVDDNLSGTYAGAWHGTASCLNTTVTTDAAGQGTVVQSGTQFRYVETDPSDPTYQCTYVGTWTQAGRLGSVSGTVSCTDGTRGTFTMSEIASSSAGFTARLAAAVTVDTNGLTVPCTLSASIGAARY